MQTPRIRNVLLVLAGVLLIALIIVRISLAPLVTHLVGSAATKSLGTDVSLVGTHAGLLRGYAGIRSIEIAQPSGFATSPPLLQLQNLSVNIAPAALFTQHIHIQEASVQSLSLHIVRNQDGILNVQQLGAPAPPKAPRDPQPPATEAPRDPQPPATNPPPRITLDRFAIEEAVLSFVDYSVDPPVTFACTNLNLELTHLLVDPARADAATNLPGALQLTTTILQPGVTNGFAGLSAAIGVVGTNVTPFNAALRIVGFDLHPLSELLPAGMTAAIGGTRLDFLADAAVAPDWLRVQTRLATTGNSWRLNIGGTPQNPVIDKSTVLFNLFSRPGDFITGKVGDATDAGVSAGKAVLSTAGKAGGGILSGVANVARGAARTAQGAAKGDAGDMAGGFADMTIGTATGAVGTISQTTQAAAAGIGDTISSASGRTASETWQADTALRWGTYWEQARQFTATAPFPGPATQTE